MFMLWLCSPNCSQELSWGVADIYFTVSSPAGRQPARQPGWLEKTPWWFCRRHRRNPEML